MTVQAFSRVRSHRLSSRRSPREFPSALHLQNGLVEALVTDSSTPLRPERSRTAGCVPFPDAARLVWTRPILEPYRVYRRLFRVRHAAVSRNALQ